MPGIDAILQMVVDQRATELKLREGGEPRLLRSGERLRFFMPVTSRETLLGMMGDLLTPERLERAAGEAVRFHHRPATLDEGFTVTVDQRGGGLELGFARGAGPRAATASVDAPAPAPAAPAPAAVVSPVEPTSGDRVLEDLLEAARVQQASDLHLADGEPPVLRVQGRLRPLTAEGPARVEALLAPWLTPPRREALAAGRAVDLAFTGVDGRRVRVNVYPHRRGLAAALRLLPGRPPPLASLGLPVDVEALVAGAPGLVLVCGPTGAGKSTTLAALAQTVLRRRGGLLVTLEDPVEYTLSAEAGALVRQRELGVDLSSFAEGLRAALREDPDVLLVGELRDAESIGLALTAAETGHLVLSTLHSGSVPSAIQRLLDAFPGERQAQVRAQLGDCLRAVVVQRLLPAARGEGRVVAMEVLRGTWAVANLLRENRVAQLRSAMQSGGGEGMVTLERCLAELVRSGRVTTAVAMEAANDKAGLEQLLREG